ncbi:MAG TPA: signal peptidase II [Rhizomicrobium sp.]|jgi:signal peptidase II|nr:signal peptidase II [Rhizomicrobium sp.]
MSRTSPRDWGLVAAAGALIADQGAKFALLYRLGFLHMAPGQGVPLLPFFNLVMVWNPGISYGLFPASSIVGTAILVLVSLAAIAGLGYWLWGMASLSLAIGVGLVIGGALGNLIDRLVYGRVADFFHLYGFGYDFYVFNVADVAITFGAVAIIYEVLKPAEA